MTVSWRFPLFRAGLLGGALIGSAGMVLAQSAETKDPYHRDCAQAREHPVQAQRAWREMTDHGGEIARGEYATGTPQNAAGMECWGRHRRTRAEQPGTSDSFSVFFNE